MKLSLKVVMMTSLSNIKLDIGWKFILAFVAFTFVLAEAHELVHTNVGYLIGGCYGPRDFNVWGVCEATNESSLAFLSTLSGPVFSFIVLWLGYFIIKRAHSVTDLSLGLAIIFAASPFSRLLTIALKKGDELLVMRMLFGTEDNLNLLWLITLSIVLLRCIPPIIAAYKALPVRNKKRTFAVLFLAPTVLFILFPIIVLNPMLTEGTLNSPGLLGAPLMISLWFFAWLAVGAVFKKDLSLWVKEQIES